MGGVGAGQGWGSISERVLPSLPGLLWFLGPVFPAMNRLPPSPKRLWRDKGLWSGVRWTWGGEKGRIVDAGGWVSRRCATRMDLWRASFRGLKPHGYHRGVAPRPADVLSHWNNRKKFISGVDEALERD